MLGDEFMGLGDVEAIGPGGNFLGTDLTLKHFRDAYYASDMFPNMTFERWQELDKPRAMDKLVTNTTQLLVSLSPPDDHAEVLAKGEKYIQTIL